MTYHAEFNEESTRIFFSLFTEFATESGKLKRGRDENVFQLLRAKYSRVLQQRLDQGAENQIQKCKNPELQKHLRIGFSDKINYFLREFLRKSNHL